MNSIINPTAKNTSGIDGLIIQRLDPYIYAFSTGEVPESLKVGDTIRLVSDRIKEWKKVYKGLKLVFTHAAKAGDDIFFRDYSVHQYLNSKPQIKNLQREDFKPGVRFSKEFFRNADESDLKEAIEDIKEDAANKTGIYSFYNSERLRIETENKRNLDIELRRNQKEVVDSFVTAVDADRRRLLLFACMRFGKTITTLYCAKKKGYKTILVLSGKTDVSGEWKASAEKFKIFDGFKFINKSKLKNHPDIINDTLSKGNTVVTFLSLQDVQGDKIKPEHETVFSTEWDLLIVDETHYGAWADKYGAVIKNHIIGENTPTDVPNQKRLKVGVMIHLSGTPYKALFEGKFDAGDIIARVQYADILKAHDEWVEKNKFDEDKEEWDNPYFGFPQLLRFAFNLNEKSQEIIKALESDGYSSGLNEIFKTRSTDKDDKGRYLEFCHVDAVLEFLRAIDGSTNDPNILSFLDYNKIKEGNLCRHIVMVLPYKASCDAMASLIKTNSFNHLNNYEIINVAGLDMPKRFKNSENVKTYISKCEEENKKTLTLTVDRMLTGVTVPEWDTMLFLKGTKSAQEYDQAIFRLQNPYVKEYYDEKRDKELKVIAKPQTFLLDFSPIRMFYLQEERTKFLNWSKDKLSNRQFKDLLEDDLRFSPIITINANDVRPVVPNEIIDAIATFEKSRSIRDEVKDIPVDRNSLLSSELKEIVSLLNGINSRKGIFMNAYRNDPNSRNEPDINISGTPAKSKSHSSNKLSKEDRNKSEEEIIYEKFKIYASLILFYAFLTYDTVRGLDDIIDSIKSNDRNRELADNIGIGVQDLEMIRKVIGSNTIGYLDDKILRINRSLNELDKESKSVSIEKISFVIKKFDRLSDSEIVTPPEIVDEMVVALYERISDGTFLDIASKQGEFAIGILKKYGEKVKNKIFSIPTSSLAYEFTRRVYELLDMPIKNISTEFNSFGLIDKKNNKQIIKKLKDMNCDVIVGNPPYQETLDSSRSLAKQLYPSFIETGVNLQPKYFAVITPTRWFTADAQDNSFPKLREFVRSNNNFSTIVTHNGKKLFPDTELNMVAYLLWEKNYIGNVDFVENINNEIQRLNRPLFEQGLDIIIPLNKIISIIGKIMKDNFISLNKITTGRNAFGIVGKEFEKRSKSKKFNNSIAVRCAYKKIRYISRKDITKGLDILDCFKVFTSKGNGGAGLLTDGKPVSIIGESFIGVPGTACTDSLIPFGKFSTRKEASNLQKYMRTRFLRFCVGILKVSQNLYQNVYAFVPMQDFKSNNDINWSKSVEDIDKQLYAKYHLTDDEIAFIDCMIRPMK